VPMERVANSYGSGTAFTGNLTEPAVLKVTLGVAIGP
jgi:hypothetical protein